MMFEVFIFDWFPLLGYRALLYTSIALTATDPILAGTGDDGRDD
jgi:hypothetical protein